MVDPIRVIQTGIMNGYELAIWILLIIVFGIIMHIILEKTNTYKKLDDYRKK